FSGRAGPLRVLHSFPTRRSSDLQTLIDFVREHSKVPVIETGAGVCHTYVESTAKLDDAASIVVNAKVSRPSVCNALDTMIVDRADRKSTRLNSSHVKISYAVFCL